MSLVLKDEDDSNSICSIVVPKQAPKQKVLEEDEYLNRMADIIERDFFPCSERPGTSSRYMSSERSDQSYLDTPGSVKTNVSTASSTRSRIHACSLKLDQFLERYTSEDNAYFAKLQRKDLKRHRLKFPWLYKDRDNHNKCVQKQLELQSKSKPESSSKMIDWPYNPRNTLFYPNSDVDEEDSNKSQSTVNYQCCKYMQQPIFKEPLPVKVNEPPKSQSSFSNKIGIDGKFLNGSETPSVNGYSLIPPPETPARESGTLVSVTSVKIEPSYYMPNESPRDELAHRLYEEKVAKRIRTPKSSTRSSSSRDSTRGTPGTAASGRNFYF